MRKIRVGNDFTVEWSIFGEKDGTRWAYDLSGKDITLKLVSPFNTTTIEDFIISGNTIIWKCYGKDQKNIGRYGLVLIENNGELGMVTIDEVSAFMLVSHTKDEDSGGCCPTLSIDHIELSTQIDMERNSEGSSDIVVDSWLSLTSENPVQNKVITKELNNKVDGLQSQIATKQDTLVSGTNIKTINGESILGEGNLTIQGGNGSYDDTEIRNELNLVFERLDDFNSEKQDTIHDLDTIRSGAEKGATALQEHQSLAGYATESFVDSAIAVAITNTINASY